MAGSSKGQKLKEKDVPAAVKAKFTALCPVITDIEWTKEEGKYKAEFDLDKSEISVLIDTLGNLLETETEISSLPQAIQKYINQNLPGEKVKESSRIVDAA